MTLSKLIKQYFSEDVGDTGIVVTAIADTTSAKAIHKNKVVLAPASGTEENKTDGPNKEEGWFNEI